MLTKRTGSPAACARMRSPSVTSACSFQTPPTPRRTASQQYPSTGAAWLGSGSRSKVWEKRMKCDDSMYHTRMDKPGVKSNSSFHSYTGTSGTIPASRQIPIHPPHAPRSTPATPQHSSKRVYPPTSNKQATQTPAKVHTRNPRLINHLKPPLHSNVHDHHQPSHSPSPSNPAQTQADPPLCLRPHVSHPHPVPPVQHQPPSPAP